MREPFLPALAILTFNQRLSCFSAPPPAQVNSLLEAFRRLEYGGKDFIPTCHEVIE
jgi:hypothetical protein